MSLSHDVIIVGSGAGGAAAAHRLVQSGLSVALIERGLPLPRDGRTLDVQQVVHEGRFKSHEPWLDGRGGRFAPEEYFNLGGKTKWYGAALLRYGAQEMRAEAPHQCPGWPIDAHDLHPYYEEAERLLGVREFACEPGLARIAERLLRRSPGWRSEPLPLGLSPDILGNRNEAAHFDGFASPAGLKSETTSRRAAGRALRHPRALDGLLPHRARICGRGQGGQPNNRRGIDSAVAGRPRRLPSGCRLLAFSLLLRKQHSFQRPPLRGLEVDRIVRSSRLGTLRPRPRPGRKPRSGPHPSRSDEGTGRPPSRLAAGHPRAAPRRAQPGVRSAGRTPARTRPARQGQRRTSPGRPTTIRLTFS